MHKAALFVLAMGLVMAGWNRSHGTEPGKENSFPGDKSVQELINGLRDPKPKVRREAAEALAKIGPKAEAAVLELIKARIYDEDLDVRISASEAVTRIATAAVPRLIEGLMNRDKYIRAYAAEELGHIGRKGEAAIPQLVELLKDDSIRVKVAAAFSLHRMKHERDRMLAVLMVGLEDEDARCSAADALGEIGPAASKAVPLLIETLKNRDNYTRSRAAYALGRIGPDAKGNSLPGGVNPFWPNFETQFLGR
jgi:HEAT repeat protein